MKLLRLERLNNFPKIIQLRCGKLCLESQISALNLRKLTNVKLEASREKQHQCGGNSRSFRITQTTSHSDSTPSLG